MTAAVQKDGACGKADRDAPGHKDSPQSGYALGCILVLFLAVVLLLFATLSLASGYYSRAVARKNREQAFHTAYGLAEALAGEFLREAPGGCVPVILAAAGNGGGLEAGGIPEDLGDCQITASYEEETGRLQIRVSVSCGTQSQSVTAILNRSDPEDGDRMEPMGRWSLGGYRKEGNEDAKSGWPGAGLEEGLK